MGGVHFPLRVDIVRRSTIFKSCHSGISTSEVCATTKVAGRLVSPIPVSCSHGNDQATLSLNSSTSVPRIAPSHFIFAKKNCSG